MTYLAPFSRRTISRRTVLVTAAAAALVGCAPMPRANPLSQADARSIMIADITVSTSGAAFKSSRAADRSSALSGDLRAALTQTFSDRRAANGVLMKVDIAVLNLASSTRSSLGRDQSRLTGSVQLIDGETVLASYPIDVVTGTAAQTTTGALAQASVTRADGFYRRLINGFASDTRELMFDYEFRGQATLSRELAKRNETTAK